MKYQTLVKIHITATGLVTIVISSFFFSSLLAELSGDISLIKTVKQSILFALPLLIIGMPTLGITGNKLAGNSRSLQVIAKKRRMKLIVMNGLILFSLAIFLYYQSHFKSLNDLFLIAQITELIFGLFNLTLIGLNIRAGLMLSGRLKLQKSTNGVSG